MNVHVVSVMIFLQNITRKSNTFLTKFFMIKNIMKLVYFKLQDAFMRHLKNWQPQRCMDMVNRLQDIEINIKSKTVVDRTLTSQSLLGLCLRARR